MSVKDGSSGQGALSFGSFAFRPSSISSRQEIKQPSIIQAVKGKCNDVEGLTQLCRVDCKENEHYNSYVKRFVFLFKAKIAI